MRKAYLACFAAVLGLAVIGHFGCSSNANGGDYTPGTGKGGGGGAGGTGSGATGQGGSGGTGVVIDSGITDSELTQDGSCAATELKAEAVPLDLYFMLDRSTSMTEKYDGQVSMTALIQGVSSFINDPASAGIFATAQRLPILGNEADLMTESCLPVDYATPDMPWSVLPYAQLASWVQLLKANGLTPSVPALQGAVDACKARLTSMAGHKCAVIFVTDGNPQGTCNADVAQAEIDLGQIAQDALNGAGIATFAIGFPGLPAAGEKVLKTIASNGGTTAPVLIAGGNVGQLFIDALNKIRGTALACEYKMPTLPAGKKPTFVVVRYTPGDGSAAQQLKRKLTKAECGQDAGWYYDDNANPTKILLCPSGCAVVQPDTKGKVEVLVMCNEQPL
jgi:hypothetical protein